MSSKLSIPLACLALCALLSACQAPAVEVDPVPPGPADWLIRPVPMSAVSIDDEFWSPRLARNRAVTIPHIIEQNELGGRHDNFRKAAGLIEGPFEGYRFNDTDVYKVVEAASYALAEHPDPELDHQVDELIAMIGAAQEDDGYLFPAWSADPDNPARGVGTERWVYVHGNSHELYGAGHLFEAAVAHYEATGKRTLLDIAIRVADLVDTVFGPDARRDVPGHEEVELALVKLARVTGEERYVDLALFFLEQRGQPHDGLEYPDGDSLLEYSEPIYRQDHLPVAQQREAVGHSVRAMYLYSGMADVAARRASADYDAALEALWEDVVASKMYLTGGIGAAGNIEGFGDRYQLPNETAYAETCAAIGLDLWNHRMFLASGEGRYLDVMERALYNGVLSGVSLEGDTFFYTNPLQSSGEAARRPYYAVACCPANIARLLGQLPGYVYAQRDHELYVNLFVGSTAEITLPAGVVRVAQSTRYPWDGVTRLAFALDAPADFELRVRLPGWARERPVPTDLYRYLDRGSDPPVLTLNGEPVAFEFVDGFAAIHREWSLGDVVEMRLPMAVRTVVSNPQVAENVGKVALQRGPLVFAAEAVDHDGRVLDLRLPAGQRFVAEYVASMLGGVVVVRGEARRGPDAVPFTAIPYFAWANRGTGEMAVWLPVTE